MPDAPAPALPPCAKGGGVPRPPFGLPPIEGLGAARVAAPPSDPRTIPGVAAALLIAAKVWHFWLGVFQVIPFLLITLVIGWLYVTKVLARKHPRQ